MTTQRRRAADPAAPASATSLPLVERGRRADESRDERVDLTTARSDAARSEVVDVLASGVWALLVAGRVVRPEASAIPAVPSREEDLLVQSAEFTEE